jgi:ADP-ribose pyrophosphatase YjhB (NUDIX family)
MIKSPLTPIVTSNQYPMPLVRVDLVILAVVEDQLSILLSHREEAPYQNQWGLPGGVLRIDLDSSLNDAAQRVARERLGRELSNLTQVVTIGGANRDPRAPWAMSVMYVSLVSPELEITPGKRVQALDWKSVNEIIKGKSLAFDHKNLIQLAVDKLREDIRTLRYPPGSMPEQFTLPELQARSEAILGIKLDKVTFRRRVESAELVLPVAGKMRGGAHRPAQVYAFR